jgi:AAA family ATP:ADP antiporter
MAGDLFKAVGPYWLMVIGGAGLVACSLLTLSAHLQDQRRHRGERDVKVHEPLRPGDGFKLVLSNRYLTLIAMLVMVLNIVNALGEFIFGRLVTEQARAQGLAGAASKQFIGGVYADYFLWINLLGVGIQLFLVSRIYKTIGVRGALFVLPVLSFGVYGLMAVTPLIGVVRWGKIMENATTYSLQNTTLHSLYLLTSREAKYKAKAAIETFFWRAGDVLQAGIVYAGTQYALSVRDFTLVNLALVAVWLVTAWLIFREHRRLSEATSGEGRRLEPRPVVAEART